MSDLTLSQILEILQDSGSSLDATMENGNEIHEYAMRVDKVATDIFNRQSRDFSKGMISLVQSIAISIMVERGDLSVLEMFKFASDDKLLEYATILVKMTVGISAMEELR